MINSRLIAGLAGSLILAPFAAAGAQEAQQPAAQVSPGCSGLGCLFRSRDSNPPQEQARQVAPPPSVPDPEDPVAKPGRAKASVSRHAVAKHTPAEKSDTVAETSSKPKARSAAVVTIAAEQTELSRVKDLAATLPRKVKVVDATPKSSKTADFVVTTSPDYNAKGMAAKLFTEQMHIVANGSIKTVADLKDKVVSFGPEKGPAPDAVRKTFSTLNIKVKETPLDLDNALDGLATGDIDAVVVMAPQPVAKLKSLSTPGLHFVAWSDESALPQGVSGTSIDGELYPNLAKAGEKIRAVGVQAVLQAGTKSTKTGAARAFLSTLSQQSGTLSKHGFDLIKADLEERGSRRIANAERR